MNSASTSVSVREPGTGSKKTKQGPVDLEDKNERVKPSVFLVGTNSSPGHTQGPQPEAVDLIKARTRGRARHVIGQISPETTKAFLIGETRNLPMNE
ncbi:hypothetical protein RRG08_047138 [Elysia crispata]|uniref:Uncharacterized protein n=1 Tax=Elysia crispata TaxID=231223 RepID=A0AAE1AP87_9GAST|nr:hypothetical protein RRG08_047138 [Elysia crispata]